MPTRLKNVVVFAVGSGRYAIELRWVREVIPVGHVTPVPHAPPAIIGVASVRGAITAILDLDVLLGAAARPSPPAMRTGDGAILIEVEGVTAGLRHSSVMEVSSLRAPEQGDPDLLIDSTGRAVRLIDPAELLARAQQASASAAADGLPGGARSGEEQRG